MHMRRGHRCGVRVHLDHIVSSESYCRVLPTLDLQKANGKLGVTAWRCETLCAIRQPAWTCGPGASAAPSALTPLACACVSNSVEAKCNNFPKRQARSGPFGVF